MKSIELKKVSVTIFGQEQELEYKPLIQVIIESPQNQQNGTKIDEIRKSIRILEQLEKSETTLELEDADYEYLKNRVKSATFTSNSKAFVDFVDYIESVGNV